MAKQLKDILKGVQASKLSKGSLGKDPGVDYQPKAGDEARFADKHMVQKHENRAGNKDDIFNATNVKYALDDKKKEPRHGRKKGDDQDVYEAREAEDVKCNESAKGVKCPVHGMAECWSAKKINEDEDDEREAGNHYSKDTTAPSAGKASKSPSNKMKQDTASSASKPSPMAEAEGDDDDMEMMKKSRQAINTENDPDKKEKLKQRHEKLASTFNRIPEEVELDEVLTKKTSAAEFIRDFVHSDNPQFEGKSKKKRMQMALAAYYSKQREKKN